jgi:transposase
MDRDSLILLLAQGLSVEKIGKRFGKHPSTVSYWMEKHGLVAVKREKHAAKGGVDRHRLEELVASGMTIAELAGELGRSKATVRHWLRQYDLRTLNALGTRAPEVAQAAKEAGLLNALMTCQRHGESEFSIEGRGYYRCKRCRSEAVTKRRRKVKAILVAEAGGRCVICGYDRYFGALAFHHLDPLQKRLHVSADGNGYALETLRAEATKCVVLCANCHADVEGGVASVPIQ